MEPLAVSMRWTHDESRAPGQWRIQADGSNWPSLAASMGRDWTIGEVTAETIEIKAFHGRTLTFRRWPENIRPVVEHVELEDDDQVELEDDDQATDWPQF